MSILKLVLPLVLVCLVAAACSNDSDDSAPTPMTAEAAAEQPAETPTAPAPGAAEAPTGETPGAAETPTAETPEIAEQLTERQQELADAIFKVLLEDDERPSAVGEDQARCLADGLARVLADERLAELGLNGPSIAAANEAEWNLALFQEFAISDGEASEMVDRALECADWRAVLAEQTAGEGVPLDQANCFASEISDEGLRTQVMIGLVSSSVAELETGGEAIAQAIRACIDIRESLYETYVQEGFSEESARCIASGLSDEAIEIMMSGQEPEDEEAGLEMLGELMALQTRCLTPEEIESMGGFGG